MSPFNLKRKVKNKPIKVLHLPTTVGGNPQGQSKHLRELGIQSESWALHQNYFGYPADRVIIRPTDSLLWTELRKLWALSYAFRFHVIIFNFGSTLFNPHVIRRDPKRHWLKSLLLPLWRRYSELMHHLELWLLRLLKRKLFIQYQGDDARQGDYCLAHFSITAATQVEPTYYTPESDALKRRQIASLTKRCCKTYALNPDLLYVLPPSAEFLPYSHISLAEWVPHYTQLADRPLRIGHAPSHRGAKGTGLILEAIERLKTNGFDFEFVLVEGLSNAEAKERYKTIDVLIDQLFFGWYGGIAVEAMALGKPVIVYIRDEDLKFLPPQMKADLPVIKTTPNEIEQALKYVLDMPRSELLSIAKRSRAYVERWHDPVAIAKRIKADIDRAISPG